MEDDGVHIMNGHESTFSHCSFFFRKIMWYVTHWSQTDPSGQVRSHPVDNVCGEQVRQGDWNVRSGEVLPMVKKVV